jgi:hypothetical protein
MPHPGTNEGGSTIPANQRRTCLSALPRLRGSSRSRWSARLPSGTNPPGLPRPAATKAKRLTYLVLSLTVSPPTSFF